MGISGNKLMRLCCRAAERSPLPGWLMVTLMQPANRTAEHKGILIHYTNLLP